MAYQRLPASFPLGYNLFTHSAHRHITFYRNNGKPFLWLWTETYLANYPEDWTKVPLKLRHPTVFSFESDECYFLPGYSDSHAEIEGLIDGWYFTLEIQRSESEDPRVLYDATWTYGKTRNLPLVVKDEDMELNTYLYPVIYAEQTVKPSDKIWYKDKIWKFVRWQGNQQLRLTRREAGEDKTVNPSVNSCKLIVTADPINSSMQTTFSSSGGLSSLSSSFSNLNISPTTKKNKKNN